MGCSLKLPAPEASGLVPRMGHPPHGILLASCGVSSRSRTINANHGVPDTMTDLEATGAGLPDEGSVRDRVRVLLDIGILPSIRPSEIRVDKTGEHDCTVCEVPFGAGEVAFGLLPPNGTVIVVHRRCFDIWTQEAAVRGANP
jgi:hypothetical protein